MNIRTLVPKQCTSNKGVVAPLVAILLIVLIGFMALAIDVGHLYVVRNELQNASDAAALAGTSVLYVESGSTLTVNTGANQVAYAHAIKNKSEKIPVDVIWQPGQNVPGSGETVDIQRGHWSFATRTFMASDSTDPPDISKSFAELDADVSFVNAMQVTTRRYDTPAASFFARLFGFQSFLAQATAVAYIGFAGTAEPNVVDFPLAVCCQAFKTDPDCCSSNPPLSCAYECGVGRLINSSSGSTTNTGAWTNFTQLLPDGTGACDTASTPTVRGYVEGGVTIPGITLNAGVGTIGGNVSDLLHRTYTRWTPYRDSGQPFPMKLIMIDCPGYPGQISNCSKIIGIVELNMIWMNLTPTNQYQNAPRTMFNPTANQQWTCNPAGTHSDSSSLDQQCWKQFVDEFSLQKADGGEPYDTFDGYMDHTLYFLPSCKVSMGGSTGGTPSNVLAKDPKLVR